MTIAKGSLFTPLNAAGPRVLDGIPMQQRATLFFAFLCIDPLFLVENPTPARGILEKILTKGLQNLPEGLQNLPEGRA